MAPWTYQPVLNACLQIWLTVGLGVALGHFNVFSVAHVPVLTKYVFHVALPCLVARGIGIGVDFYSEAFIWEYIGSFLLLRGVALAVSVAVVGHRPLLVALRLRAPESPSRLPELAAEPLEQQRCAGQTVTVLGDVTVVWLNATWISTVILGIPILTAVFGTPKLGAFYGLLAGISSFIFQLPFMLAMLEGHALVLKLRAADGMVDDSAVPDCAAPTSAAAGGEASATVGVVGSVAPPDGTPLTTEWEILLRRNVWWRVLTKVAVNPVMWGIAGGFVISLSTLGERYLRGQSGEYVDELGFFEAALKWFGDSVSPVSLFAMGVWMQHEGRGLLAIGGPELGGYMLAKLLVTPLLMVGIAKIMDLDDRSGRAAVLIATLPISLASFTLGKQYGVGEAALAANVAVGTLLMLPTVIAWSAAMDHAGLYVV